MINPPYILDILPNNPRNQPDGHIPFCVNPRDHEADIILLAGHPVVVAAVGDGVDADMEADEDGALMDVRDRPGILALNLALAQVGDERPLEPALDLPDGLPGPGVLRDGLCGM